MTEIIPNNLYAFYRENPSSFEERISTTKKAVYVGLFVFSLLLVFMPAIIPLSSGIVRVAAIIGAIIFGIAVLVGGQDYYSKKSGGKINDIAIKKFYSPAVDEQQILSMLEANDFIGLSELHEADNQPLQLYIHEDKSGKVFYLQAMKFFSQSDFRGISEVKVISEPEYSIFYKTIKSIKSTS